MMVGAGGLGRAVVEDPGVFGAWGVGRALRGYQLEVARAVARSVAAGAGLTFTVLFPRQAGKNELSAQLEAWLLFRYQRAGGSVVKAAPTFRPQSLTSMLRLERMLAGRLTRGRWRKVQGYRYELGRASCSFFSAQPGANIVGATASLLLEGDEAQDLDAAKWDRALVPMGAVGNATRVLYGTPWTDETLLAREVERARELERRDGVRRHFEVGWERVAEAVPAYGRHVEAEIARLGASHPIVRTQYLLEPLARADRLLSGEQLAKLRGEHRALEGPGERPAGWGRGAFVAGIDVAGADETDPETLLVRANPARDSTVLAIAYAEERLVEGSGASGAAGWSSNGGGVVEPRLWVCHLYAWRGAPQRELYPVILSLVRERWRCRTVVVDATGVGGGLAAFLGAALGPRMVAPYVYTAASKSKLGYDLLAALNGGRLKLFGAGEPLDQAERRRELLAQCEAATSEPRGNQVLRWGVPAAKGHDDLLNALALCVQAGPLSGRRVAVGRRPG